MKRRTLLGMVGAAIPVASLAQDGALTASITATKLAISSFTVLSPPSGNASAFVGVSVQTAGGVQTDARGISIPNPAIPSLTVLSLITAMMTIRSGETGSNARKMSFRVLGELFDKGALPEINAVNP